MKKLTALISFIVIILSLSSCDKASALYDVEREFVTGKVFRYEGEGCGSEFDISFNENGTFTYYEGMLSSHMGMGIWKIEDGELVMSEWRTVLNTEDGDFKAEKREFEYAFRRSDESLVFLEERSDDFTYLRIPEGGKFTQVTEDDDNAGNT